MPFTVKVTTTARGMAVPVGDHRSPLQPSPWARHAVPLLLGLLLLIAGVTVSRRRFKPQSRIASLRWAPLATAMLAIMLWQACGGGGGTPLAPRPTGTPAGDYTLTVMVSAGDITKVLGLKVN